MHDLISFDPLAFGLYKKSHELVVSFLVHLHLFLACHRHVVKGLSINQKGTGWSILLLVFDNMARLDNELLAFGTVYLFS